MAGFKNKEQALIGLPIITIPNVFQEKKNRAPYQRRKFKYTILSDG
jgi:hypothetical protein